MLWQKNSRPLRDFVWMSELDEAKGVCVGKTYRNAKGAHSFTTAIAKSLLEDVTTSLSDVDFISVISDGSTDSSVTEQEIIYTRFCQRGVVSVTYVGLATPPRADAEGITSCITSVLDTVGVSTEVISKKLVAVGCDGASVMLGKATGVGVRLQEIQPSCVVVHCFAHRLELSWKDATQKRSLYVKCSNLLMGLYYFYKKSYLQRRCLKESYAAINLPVSIPTRVSGTRWVGHMKLALDVFFKGYDAILQHVTDLQNQTAASEAKSKALGFRKLMLSSDIIAYMCFLRDILTQLTKLSLSLQDRYITAAAASSKLEATQEYIMEYGTRDGPHLTSVLKSIQSDSQSDDGDESDTGSTDGDSPIRQLMLRDNVLTGGTGLAQFKPARADLVKNLKQVIGYAFRQYSKTKEGKRSGESHPCGQCYTYSQLQ